MNAEEELQKAEAQVQQLRAAEQAAKDARTKLRQEQSIRVAATKQLVSDILQAVYSWKRLKKSQKLDSDVLAKIVAIAHTPLDQVELKSDDPEELVPVVTATTEEDDESKESLSQLEREQEGEFKG